jgi:hypothetical protein
VRKDARHPTHIVSDLLTKTNTASRDSGFAGKINLYIKARNDLQTRKLKACGRRIGRRVYYPAAEVARIIVAAFSFP